MALQSTWRLLPLPESSSLPVLLASIEIDAAAYTVRVTDMANMWVESLDRKAICMRGWGENTSIDPSDTPENMAQFLASIRSALDPSHPSHGQTFMSLAPASPTDAGEGGLTLRVTCNLPGLQPLKWPMHLRKASPSTMATALVLPLIQAHYSRTREIESLVSMLGQKDGVVTKLLDKLEATGTGLEHVFNALSGKKKVTRSSAETRVKGLAPFNRSQWQSEMDREEGPETASSLIHEVFATDGVRHHGSLEIEDSPKLDRWWLDLKGTLQLPQRERSTETQRDQKHQSPPINTSGEDDDDFQVQATPPHLVSKTRNKPSDKVQSTDEASTDSGEDEDPASPAVAKEAPVSAEPSPGKSKPITMAPRLGVVGGKKHPAPQRSASPKQLEDNGKREATHTAGSDTASDIADNDNETASTMDPSPPPSPPKKLTPQKGRLGRIGGRSARAQVSQADNEAAIDNAIPDTKLQVPVSRPPKLGMIGKAKQDASPPARDNSERGRVPSRETTKPKNEPRETSMERADRRREELKRELERKAAAGPVKKKRKF